MILRISELRATASRRSLVLLATTLLCFGCAAPASAPQATQPSSPVASDAPSASSTPGRSEAATASAAPSASLELVADGLAEVLVDDLTLRVDPGTGGQRIGVLPLGEPAYVVAGPVNVDGYQWYQLASVRQPYRGTCGDPAPEPSLECATWFGWAAATTPGGDRWLGAAEANCPAARDTDAYLSLLPAERLACAGSDEWRLTAYVAPQTEGRGCYPVYVVDPSWLDASCNLRSFLQPEETQFDSFEGLQVSVHPQLGSCTLEADRSDCPFEGLKASWIEVTGHLDDPAARECAPVLSTSFEEAPHPPPSTEEVVFGCRLAFVVTDVEPTQPPGG